jgi:hypothetical protein
MERVAEFLAPQWPPRPVVVHDVKHACGDPARIVDQAHEQVDVLRGLEEWDSGPGGRPE